MAHFVLDNFTVFRYGEELFSASLAFSGDGFCMLGGRRSGKTPFALGLCGEEQTEGKILFDGEQFHTLSPKERNCGVLFGARTLFRGTVRENIAYGLILRGEDREVALKKAEQESALLGMESILDVPAKKCDFLTAQKVAFLRLTARNPRFIVLDFPVRGDGKEELQFLSDAKKIAAQKGIFLILTTENARQAALFDFVGVLGGGKVEAFAKRETLLAAPPSLSCGRLLSETYNELCGKTVGGTLYIADAAIMPYAEKEGWATVFCYENAFTVGEKRADGIPVRVDFCEPVTEYDEPLWAMTEYDEPVDFAVGEHGAVSINENGAAKTADGERRAEECGSNGERCAEECGSDSEQRAEKCGSNSERRTEKCGSNSERRTAECGSNSERRAEECGSDSEQRAEKGSSKEDACLYRYYLDFDLTGEEKNGEITRFTTLSRRKPCAEDDFLTVRPHAEKIHIFFGNPAYRTGLSKRRNRK